MERPDPAGYFEGPSTGNAAEANLTAATPTGELATGVGDASDRVLTIASTSAFNILFGDASVADPGDTGVFPAGIYSFNLRRIWTHFSLTPAANGKLKYWRSSRT